MEKRDQLEELLREELTELQEKKRMCSGKRISVFQKRLKRLYMPESGKDPGG